MASIATVTSAKSATTEPAQALSTTRLAFILLILGISYMINAMDRQVFPAVLGPITKEYGLKLSSAGFLGTSFALMVAIFGALSGWFMSRFGRRTTLVGGLIGFSVFTALTPLADGFLGLGLFRSMTGAGEALHIGAIFACLGAYFGERRGMAIGIVNAFFGIGAFLGPVLGTLMLAHSGSWRAPFQLFAVLGVLAAALVFLIVPKQFMEAADTEGVKAGKPEAKPKLASLFNRDFTLCVLGLSLVGFTLYAYIALYATYLRTNFSYSTVEAGAAFGSYGIGALGALGGGWLSDRLGMKGMYAALLALAVVGYAMFHGSASPGFQAGMSIAFGFLISGYLYPRFFATIQRNVHPAHVGYAMSVAIPMFYLPGLVAGYTFGRIAESIDWPTAATLTVCLPAALALGIMMFYRNHNARGN